MSENIKGYINKQYTVWCGCCGNWHQESTNSVTRFSKLVYSLGWRKTEKHGWVCPECQEKEKR